MSFPKNLTQQPAFVLRILFAAWLAMKILCWQAFTGDRPFFCVPVMDALLSIPAYWHNILLWIAIACMAIALFLPEKKLLWILLISELLSCMLDQNRWQPWEYQAIFMLAAYLFLKSESDFLRACQLITIGVYFFSGLSKLNPAFIHDTWSGLILQRWLGIKISGIWTYRLGYCIPLAEMLSAVLLLFVRWQRIAILFLVMMHVAILTMLGPAGLNLNEAIWPWNLLMICLLLLLFGSGRPAFDKAFFRKKFSWLLAALFWLLPFLSLAGYWDHYLSFSLYSGGLPQLYICTSDPAALQRMAPYMSKLRNGMIPCTYPVSTFTWALKAMNTATYPEKRVFRSIAMQWKKSYPAADVHFYIYTSGFTYTVEELIIE